MTSAPLPHPERGGSTARLLPEGTADRPFPRHPWALLIVAVLLQTMLTFPLMLVFLGGSEGMGQVARSFKEGGLWMYLLLALFLMSHPLLAIVGLVRTRFRFPRLLLFVPALLLVAVGLLGAWVGASQLIEALDFAAPDMRARLVHRGAAIAGIPLIFGLGLAGVSSFCVAGLTLLGTAHLRPTRSAGGRVGVWAHAPAAGAALLGVLAVAVVGGATDGALRQAPVLFGLFLVFLLLGAVGQQLAIVALRRLGPDSAAEGVSDATGGLLVGGLALALALALVGLALRATHAGAVHQALEFAVPDMRARLLARGLASLQVARLATWVAAGAALFMAIAAVLPFAGRMLDFLKRRAVSLGVAAVLILGLVGGHHLHAERLDKLSKSVGDVHRALLQDPDVSLPEGKATMFPDKRLRIFVGRQSVRVDRLKVLDLQGGLVPATVKKGGATSLMVTPLFDALSEQVERQKQLAVLGAGRFKGEVLLVADRKTPYRLLCEVLYTAAQAELGTPAIAVRSLDHGGDEARMAPLFLPRMGIPREDMPPEELPLNLAVGLSERGYTVHAAGAELAGDPAAPLKDLPALYARLAQIKDKHPDEQTLTFYADDKLPLQRLVRAMGVVRLRLERDHYESAEELLSARPRFDARHPRLPMELFPDVTLAVGSAPAPSAREPSAPRSARLAARRQGIAAILGARGDRLGGGPSLSDVFATPGKVGAKGSGRGGLGGGAGGLGLGGTGTVGAGRGTSGLAGLGQRRSPRPAQLAAGSGDVVGAMDKKSITRVIRSRRNGIKYCYQKELARQPKLQGKVVVAFTIGPNGRVIKASIPESTLGNKQVGNCIVRQVRRWRFPQPKGGGVVKVKYPFIFRAD